MLFVQDTAAEMLATEQLRHIVALELDLGSFFDSFALMFIFDWFSWCFD